MQQKTETDPIQLSRKRAARDQRVAEMRETLTKRIAMAERMSAVRFNSFLKKIKRGRVEKPGKHGFRGPGEFKLVAPDSMIQELQSEDPNWEYWVVGLKIPKGEGGVVKTPHSSLIVKP